MTTVERTRVAHFAVTDWLIETVTEVDVNDSEAELLENFPCELTSVPVITCDRKLSGLVFDKHRAERLKHYSFAAAKSEHKLRVLRPAEKTAVEESRRAVNSTHGKARQSKVEQLHITLAGRGSGEGNQSWFHKLVLYVFRKRSAAPTAPLTGSRYWSQQRYRKTHCLNRSSMKLLVTVFAMAVDLAVGNAELNETRKRLIGPYALYEKRNNNYLEKKIVAFPLSAELGLAKKCRRRDLRTIRLLRFIVARAPKRVSRL
jgi:hypothetical protein